MPVLVVRKADSNDLLFLGSFSAPFLRVKKDKIKGKTGKQLHRNVTNLGKIIIILFFYTLFIVPRFSLKNLHHQWREGYEKQKSTVCGLWDTAIRSCKYNGPSLLLLFVAAIIKSFWFIDWQYCMLIYCFKKVIFLCTVDWSLASVSHCHSNQFVTMATTVFYTNVYIL